MLVVAAGPAGRLARRGPSANCSPTDPISSGSRLLSPAYDTVPTTLYAMLHVSRRIWSIVVVGFRSQTSTLGAGTASDGCLTVTDHQETSVPGLFAAGDLVRGLNQISTAEGEAAIAATAIHNRLRER